MGQSSWSKVLRENASKKGASDRRMISNKLVNRLKSFNQTCKEHHSRRQYSFDRLASDLNESTSSHIQHIEIELDGESAEKMIEFVDHILPSIRSYIMKDNPGFPSTRRLKEFAIDDSLWLSLLSTLINHIEIDDPLGGSIIAIFIEEALLPSKEQVVNLLDKLIDDRMAYSDKLLRNILIVLGFLSEKVAGTQVAVTLNEKAVDFTLSCLINDSIVSSQSTSKLSIILASLIALEKYSMSAQTKQLIISQLGNKVPNPLISLSQWQNDQNSLKHQIGFLAQYLLDNIATPDDYVYGYLRLAETSDVNVKLNDKDTSESLKLSPNGFEARNDSLSFESVRSTVQVDSGVWFYEVTLLTSGIMQIGFATKSASFLNDQGFGIGDDGFSVGYDGCRNFIWHNANNLPVKTKSKWKEGDVIGFLLDIKNKKICFYHNGQQVSPVHTEFFRRITLREGIFPAASFMTFQHVAFNFGREPFKYPPSGVEFSNFNEFGTLRADEKYILPKRKRLEILRQVRIKDDACSICYENQANVILLPCKHSGFCESCTLRVVLCPICRTELSNYEFN